jgi:hypothetical protein
MKKKLLFIGAGAVGSYLGSFLSRDGHDVTLVDPWAENVETIRRQGIHATGPHEPFEAHPTAVHLNEAARLDRDYDIAFDLADLPGLGEFLTAGIGAQCMVWQTSPAAAELEEAVLDWLRLMTGLPEGWAGVIQDTASTATLCALVSARERATGFASNDEGVRMPLTVYASEEAHSSVEKGVKIAAPDSVWLSTSALPDLLPGERTVHSRKRLWAVVNKSWPIYRLFFSLPPLWSAGLYLTDRRILFIGMTFVCLRRRLLRVHGRVAQPLLT